MSNLAGGIKQTVFKIMNEYKIDNLIESIKIVIAKNRRYFSEEDIAFNSQCLKELRLIKNAFLKKRDSVKNASRLAKVVENLGLFFGCADNIQEILDLP